MPRRVPAAHPDDALALWRDLLAADPVARDPDELARRRESAGLVEDGHPVCRVVRPRFVSAARHRQESHLAASVVAALRATLAAVEGGSAHGGDLAGLREWAARVRALDPRPSARSAAWLRLDASLARTQLHVLELNADAPIGEGHNDSVVDLLEGLPVTAAMTARTGGRLLRLLPALHARIAEALSRSHAVAGAAVAWACWEDMPDRRRKVASISAHLERQGMRVLMVDPREITTGPRGTSAGGVPVGVVLRLCTTPECLDRPEGATALRAAARDGRTVVLNGLGTEPLGHKALLAALTDPHVAPLGPAARRVVARHVPWTRVLADVRTTGPHGDEVDLLAWSSANRAHLVLKPADGLAGRDVVLGWRTTPAGWDAAIAAGTGRDVVQVRVHLQREPYPVIAPGLPEETFYEDTDPFLIGGRVAGMLTRLSATEITNVGAGGGVTATMVLPGSR